MGRITSVKYGELRSTERYGNVSLTLEAEVNEGEDYNAVKGYLKAEVCKHLDNEVKRKNAAAQRLIKKLSEWTGRDYGN
jgi:hypothetical protein